MMAVTHRETIHARCPVEPDVFDYYEVVVEAGRVVEVERVRAAIRELAGATIFQEDLTRRLADAIGAKVTTSGLHHTTRTTVVCLPGDEVRAA